jgi:hypothetical protein
VVVVRAGWLVMKMMVLRNWLAAAAALGESLAILDLKGVMPLLPEGWAVWVAGVPTFAALVVHVVKAFDDSLGRLGEEEDEGV